MNSTPQDNPAGRVSRAVPRGLATSGPVVFSYGFRPFFLGGAAWAAIAMLLWIASLGFGWDIAGPYGAAHWHAHEMLFGFTPAVLAGFLLTAVPNWTGRLPVSGRPLMLLFALWAAGRLALPAAGLIGVELAVAADILFLPALLFACAREVIAGRKWHDLKVVGGLLALSAGNLLFHAAVLGGEAAHSGIASRLAVATYVMLIILVGGRILPSFTRNWLKKAGHARFPAPHGVVDRVAIAAGLLALSAWVARPEHPATAVIAAAAALAHAVRLSRWRGLATWPEGLLVILHVAYAFVPLGLFGIALGAIEVIDTVSVLHLLAVGVVASMMIAVMHRVSRGHTGRQLTASRLTSLSYAAIALAAIARPLANILPQFYTPLVALAGILWIVAFGLFCCDCGPMLLRVRRTARGAD